MAPSKQDRKNMWHGAIWFFGLLLIINSILLLFNIDPRQYIANVLQHLSAVFTIFLYALIIAIAHYIISTLLVIVPKKLWQTHIKKYFADETRTLK